MNDNTHTLTAEDIEDGHTLACYGYGSERPCDECWSLGDCEVTP